jgi:hypothetical protein
MANAKLLSQVFIFLYFLSISIFYFNMLFIFLNKKFLLPIQEFILLMNGSYQFIQFFFLLHVKVGKTGKHIIFIFTRTTLITRCSIRGVVLDCTFFLLSSFAMKHLWTTLGKRRPLLTAMLAASSLEEESMELLSESHSRHTWASPPSSCSTSSSPSSSPSCRHPCHYH